MDWQDDVLQHVRGVHCSLVGLSVALMIANSLLPSASIDDAYTQLQQVNTIRSQYFSFDKLKPITFEREIDFFSTDTRYEVTPRANRILDIIIDVIPFADLNAQPVFVSSLTWGTIQLTRDAKRHEQIFWELPIFSADNLNQFEASWDFLGEAFPATVQDFRLDEIRYFLRGEEISSCRKLNHPLKNGDCIETSRDERSAEDNGQSVDFRVGFMEIKDNTRTFAPREWYVVAELASPASSVDLGFDQVRVPVDVSYGSSMGVQGIVVPVDVLPVATGPARDSFGDLFNIAGGLESLEFDQLLPYVRQLRDKDDEKVSVLGVDVPLSLISQWGVFLLVIFQMYFLLHLLHLRRLTFDRAVLEHFPWIGTYPDHISSGVFLISISVLPVTSALVLAKPLLSPAEANVQPWLLFLLLSCSAGLAFMSVFCARNWTKGKLFAKDAGVEGAENRLQSPSFSSHLDHKKKMACGSNAMDDSTPSKFKCD